MFYILLFMVIINFIGNVLDFQGRDVAVMFQPMRFLLLSYERTYRNAANTYVLIQLCPVLVAYTAGLSLAREYQLGTRIFLVSRIGNFKYPGSKYLSVFLVTMIIFTVPFLLEIFLNCMSFPLSASGNLLELSFYDSQYRDAVNHYFMKSIYFYSPYLYAVIGTLLFGAVSGLLGVFTVAVSSLIKFRYNVFLLMPVYAVLNLSTIYESRLLENVSSMKPSIRWYDYVLIFNDRIKNMGYLVIGISVIVLFSIVAACISGRKDCL
ncbi:MAG: hypothetical protein K2K09_05260 [Lachnospiraceae bacterium]|nr:hypothetical protein [Lachnospiraceae bacterium]